MRHYKIWFHGRYIVPMPNAPTLFRPNRLAAGLCVTLGKQRLIVPNYPSRCSEVALRLSVYGTLDSLAIWTGKAKHNPLGGRLCLSDRGKRKLANLRRVRAERLAARASAALAQAATALATLSDSAR